MEATTFVHKVTLSGNEFPFKIGQKFAWKGDDFIDATHSTLHNVKVQIFVTSILNEFW